VLTSSHALVPAGDRHPEVHQLRPQHRAVLRRMPQVRHQRAHAAAGVLRGRRRQVNLQPGICWCTRPSSPCSMCTLLSRLLSFSAIKVVVVVLLPAACPGGGAAIPCATHPCLTTPSPISSHCSSTGLALYPASRPCHYHLSMSSGTKTTLQARADGGPGAGGGDGPGAAAGLVRRGAAHRAGRGAGAALPAQVGGAAPLQP
jgi:hypothetical protein